MRPARVGRRQENHFRPQPDGLVAAYRQPVGPIVVDRHRFRPGRHRDLAAGPEPADANRSGNLRRLRCEQVNLASRRAGLLRFRQAHGPVGIEFEAHAIHFVRCRELGRREINRHPPQSAAVGGSERAGVVLFEFGNLLLQPGQQRRRAARQPDGTMGALAVGEQLDGHRMANQLETALLRVDVNAGVLRRQRSVGLDGELDAKRLHDMPPRREVQSDLRPAVRPKRFQAGGQNLVRLALDFIQQIVRAGIRLHLRLQLRR